MRNDVLQVHAQPAQNPCLMVTADIGRYTSRTQEDVSMSALTFAAFVFIATFMAALLGFQLQRFVPEAYTNDATEGHVKVMLGMLSMLTTVVLGFVTAEAKNSFDNAAKIVSDTAVRLVSIDRVLADFGEDAAPVRRRIKEAAQGWITRINSPEGDQHADLGVVQRGEVLENLVDEIKALKPTSDAQADDKARAGEFADGILHDRWMLQTERAASTPTVFLYVVLAWLAIEFFVFGLFVSRNAMVMLATFLGALTVASAMFLVLDLEGVMTGPMRISTASLERAVAIMGQ